MDIFWANLNAMVCILCTICCATVIFETRDGAIEDDGSLDVLQATIGMILKLLSLFYISLIDNQFVLAEEKKACVKYLQGKKNEIINDKCESCGNACRLQNQQHCHLVLLLLCLL